MPIDAYLLYIDHQGHPAPLTQCYHATAARRLSSSVPRNPPSTVVEADSAFCPQCLSFHDIAAATRLQYCASCRSCPVCRAVCRVQAKDNLCFYECGRCNWTSVECDLCESVEASEDGSYDRMTLARAVEAMKETCKDRTTKDPVNQHVRQITNAWQARTAREAPPKHVDEWSIETLEARMQEKQQSFFHKTNLELATQSLDEPTLLDPSLAEQPASSYLLQAWNSSAPTRARHDLLPLPIPLRLRYSRRCRAELTLGRPGILLKPKLNPLEGDSSLRSGHGQWWKKDSSAIHSVPQVKVLQHVAAEGAHVFLLQANNPTLGPVRLRFRTSEYQGEVDPNNAESFSRTFSDLLLDEFTQTYVTAELNSDAVKDMLTTDEVELQSGEDNFLDMGASMPFPVASWLPSRMSDEPTLLNVATKSSMAWFEFILPFPEEPSDFAPAIPFTMDVQVGDGSWESSLIQPREGLEGPDWVSLDLLLVWKET